MHTYQHFDSPRSATGTVLHLTMNGVMPLSIEDIGQSGEGEHVELIIDNERGTPRDSKPRNPYL